jgi:hypothetical protein
VLATTQMSRKFMRLRDQLGVPEYECVGLLTLLWLVCAREAPDGGIGKLSNDDIAYMLGWKRSSPDELVAVLIERGWLDEDRIYRLICHDWSQHCEDRIDAQLARAGRVYADGAMPRMKKIGAAEKAVLQVRCQDARGEWIRAHDVAASGSQRQPAAAGGALSENDAEHAAPTVPFQAIARSVPFRSAHEDAASSREVHGAACGGSRAPGTMGSAGTGSPNTTQRGAPEPQPIAGTVTTLVDATLRKQNATQRNGVSPVTGMPGAREPPHAAPWTSREEQKRLVGAIIELTGDAKSEPNWVIVVSTLCQTRAGYEALVDSCDLLRQRRGRDWPQNPGAELNRRLRAQISNLGLSFVRRLGERSPTLGSFGV